MELHESRLTLEDVEIKLELILWLKITLKTTPYDARNSQQLFRVEKM